MSIIYSQEYLDFCNEHKNENKRNTHHIIMKSDGGTNEESNLAHMLAENHMKAHELLWECNKDNPDNKARLQVLGAYNFSKGLDSQQGENHPMYGDHRNAGENNPMYNKHHTEESKQKMKEAKLGKYDGENNPQAKAIVQLTLDGEFVREYSYINEAKQYGFRKSGSITDCCKGRKDSYKGFKWLYKRDYDKLNNETDTRSEI